MVVALKYCFLVSDASRTYLQIDPTYFDDTKTVAAQSEVVRAVTSAAIAKVERLLPLERWSGIGVRDRHLADGQPMENAAALEANIVQHRAFARVEGQAEAPLLPLHQRLVPYSERGPVGLQHVKWLEILANAVRKEFGNVLGRASVLEDLLAMRLTSKSIALAAGSKPVDSYDLLLVGIHDRDQGQRVAVKVTVRIPIAGVLSEDQSLEITPVLVGQV
jgi:hypothetical protein